MTRVVSQRPYPVGRLVRVILYHETGKILERYQGSSGWEYSVQISSNTVIQVKHKDLEPY